MVCSATMDHDPTPQSDQCYQLSEASTASQVALGTPPILPRTCSCPCRCGYREKQADLQTSVSQNEGLTPPSTRSSSATNPFHHSYRSSASEIKDQCFASTTKSLTSDVSVQEEGRNSTGKNCTGKSTEKPQVLTIPIPRPPQLSQVSEKSPLKNTSHQIKLQTEGGRSLKQDIIFEEKGKERIKGRPMAKVQPQIRSDPSKMRSLTDSPTHVKLPMLTLADRNHFDQVKPSRLVMGGCDSSGSSDHLAIRIDGEEHIPMLCEPAPTQPRMKHHTYQPSQSQVSLKHLQQGLHYSALIKRSTGPSLEYKQPHWGNLTTDEPMSRTPSPSIHPPVSPSTNPFLQPSFIGGPAGGGSSSPLGSACKTITFYPSPQPSPSSTMPPSFATVIDEYSKVCGYDASKDQQLRRAYHLLEESRCYYGKLSMSEARKKLKYAPTGSYLLRDSSDPAYLFALSIKTVRGTTSIRISYKLGLFQLDCEEDVLNKMPVFDCIMKLLDFYTTLTAMKENNVFVFHESSGRRDTAVNLSQPFVHSVGSLKGMARRTLNTMLSEEQRRKLLLFMPPAVEKFMCDYPYRI